MFRLIAFSLATFANTLIFAHSGGLDANGGHLDHKTGMYHYHRYEANSDVAMARTTPWIPQPPRPRLHPRMVARLKALDDGRQVVYVTRTGKHYHSKDCPITANAVPVSLVDAAKKCTPCPKCHPPTVNPIVSGKIAHVADPDILERRAAEKLRLAKKLLPEKPKLCQKWLQEILNDYPGTLAAGEAEALLVQLQQDSALRISPRRHSLVNSAGVRCSRRLLLRNRLAG